MPENNGNELGFTFGRFKNTIQDRLTTHRKQTEENHKLLLDTANVIEKNLQKAKIAGVIKEDDLINEVPPFVANHAKDTGKSVRELVGNEKDDNEVENSHSKGEAEKEGTEADQPPVKLLDKKKVRGLADTLKARVFGQDKTINEVVGVLKIAALNIKINEAKPAGCYFFAGPSGVGKTELAQSIADQLGVKLLKINMGEYSQEQDVSKLIGTAKGLVGYKEGGLLTNFVKKNPACVVLFDEIEKADPSMDNILLSIMDHGECGANDGSTVAFKDTIVISTSNLGADVEYYQDMSKEEKDTLRMAYIKDGLRPEIINRYDSIFHFNALTPEIYKMVASKFLNKLSSSMVEQHGFNIKFSPQLVDFMIDKSYDPAMGGRPARKFIEKIIIQPLADYMLEDEFENTAKEHKEITMDLNKSGKICFKGKNRKILGVLENTEELVAEFEAGKFTNKTTKSAKP